ncbi:MAG TPA: CBS domain-containing protein [Nitrospirae bacterium]|nr:CBS domain-containing protein [Nitrospirota bacterium]
MSKRVADLIGAEPVTIHMIPAMLPVTEAAKKMVKKNVGSLIVKKENKYVGIITDRDITKCMATRKDLLKVKVEEAMTADLQFITPDETLEYCAQLMRELDVRYLPVFDGESIIFILSMSQITFDDLPPLLGGAKTVQRKF